MKRRRQAAEKNCLTIMQTAMKQTFTSAAGQVTFREIKDTDNLRIEGLRQKPDDLISAGEEKIDGEEIVNAIILLDAKSLLERGYEASEIPQSFWAGVIEDSLNRKQDKLADKVTSRFDEVEVNYYYTIGICGIGITTPYKNIEGLKNSAESRTLFFLPCIRSRMQMNPTRSLEQRLPGKKQDIQEKA